MDDRRDTKADTVELHDGRVVSLRRLGPVPVSVHVMPGGSLSQLIAPSDRVCPYLSVTGRPKSAGSSEGAAAC
jgi:hypothetical protein